LLLYKTDTKQQNYFYIFK